MRLVVAAVMERSDGRILVQRRPPGQSMAGLWEFPGGGVESGETAEAALARELREELGIEAAVEEPLTFAWHRDTERELLLLFYAASIRAGTPIGLQGQELRWVTPGELRRLPTPPADAVLVARLAR